MSNDNVIPLNESEISKLNKELRDSMKDTIEYYKIIAELRRASYNEYINVGFSPSDALELCKNV